MFYKYHCMLCSIYSPYFSCTCLIKVFVCCVLLSVYVVLFCACLCILNVFHALIELRSANQKLLCFRVLLNSVNSVNKPERTSANQVQVVIFFRALLCFFYQTKRQNMTFNLIFEEISIKIYNICMAYSG